MARNSTSAAENGAVGTIHLTLQGKGGVGKSLIASVLAQYHRQTGLDVRCIDTDPVNRTFAQYGALQADRLCLSRVLQKQHKGHPAPTRRIEAPRPVCPLLPLY